jgi:hypothetical protein
VSLLLAAEEALTAHAATRRVRVGQAARSLHRLRRALRSGDGTPGGGGRLGGRVRRAERRAQEALVRAGFADPAVAAEVLRQAQVLSLTATLAMLDYATRR